MPVVSIAPFLCVHGLPKDRGQRAAVLDLSYGEPGLDRRQSVWKDSQ